MGSGVAVPFLDGEVHGFCRGDEHDGISLCQGSGPLIKGVALWCEMVSEVTQ